MWLISSFGFPPVITLTFTVVVFTNSWINPNQILSLLSRESCLLPPPFLVSWYVTPFSIKCEGKICNCVRFVLAFSYAMFVVFYPFIYQSLCVEFGIDRIRNPSPDRSTKKPFVMGARSLHADVTVDCETDIYGFQGPDCSLCQAI